MKRALTCLIILGLALAGCQRPSHEAQNADHYSTAFARVVATHEIRCGYATQPGLFMKDEKTGEASGMMVDFMNEVARQANINVVWDHEVDWGLLRQEFDTQKIDAMCGSDWLQPHKLRQVYYTNPFAYDGLNAFVRASDNRFDQDMSKANDESVTICVIENDGSDNIARSYFPRAKRLAVSPLESEPGCMINVKTGKADIALVGNVTAGDYEASNPGALKRAANGKPVTYYPVGIAVAHGDNDMVQLFNTAIEQMKVTGFLDRLMNKYEKQYPGTYHNLKERLN